MTATALDLSPQEWQAYHPADGLRHLAINQPGAAERRRRAMRTARQLSALLKEQFKAQKVALFGSLIHAQRFTATSDIDLAVWGLPPEHFYAAVAAVTGFSAEFQVDLVEVESCSPTLRQVIEQENIPL